MNKSKYYAFSKDTCRILAQAISVPVDSTQMLDIVYQLQFISSLPYGSRSVLYIFNYVFCLKPRKEKFNEIAGIEGIAFAIQSNKHGR